MSKFDEKKYREVTRMMLDKMVRINIEIDNITALFEEKIRVSEKDVQIAMEILHEEIEKSGLQQQQKELMKSIASMIFQLQIMEEKIWKEQNLSYVA